jgi:hypothetical protein
MARNKSETDYAAKALEAAADTVREYLKQVCEQLVDYGKASDDLLNDYPNGDAYHHESHVDEAYNLQEAAQLLDELGEYEETDSGLWDRQTPRDAISTQAAFTYGNAVYSMFCELIRQINDDEDIKEVLTAHKEREAADLDSEGEYPSSCLPSWVWAELGMALRATLPETGRALEGPMGPAERNELRDMLRDANREELCDLVTDGTVSADLEQRILAIVKEG